MALTPWAEIAKTVVYINIIGILFISFWVVKCLFYFGDFTTFLQLYFNSKTDEGWRNLAAIILCFVTILIVAVSISTGFLLRGINENSNELIIPWLIVWACIICLGFLEVLRERLIGNMEMKATHLLAIIGACIMYFPVYMKYKETCDGSEPEPTV